MIHLGETEIFEWQMPQTIDRLIGSELAFADLLEKLADGFGVQAVLNSLITRRSAGYDLA